MTGADTILDGRPWRVALGNCLDVLQWLPDDSIDSIVTDPPYGLGKEPDALAMLTDWIGTGHHEVTGKGFMGKAWDAFVPQPVLWAECLRVLKPGGHLLAFGGTRTFDLVLLGLRIAGFEIRDSLATLLWVHGQGFPKSRNISKDIDAAAGAEREVVGARTVAADKWTAGGRAALERGESSYPIQDGAPATEAAKQWDGWGTALKPSHESVAVVRKPLEGTVAGNVLKWGTGGINVDGCRVGTSGATKRSHQAEYSDSGWRTGHEIEEVNAGRWPPNILLVHHPDCTTECVPSCHVREMGEQSGERTSGAVKAGRPAGSNAAFGKELSRIHTRDIPTDTGTAARFFPQFRYCAKPSKAEKVAGVTPRKVSGGEATGREDGSPGTQSPSAGAGRTGSDAPMHPTTKPISLMRWLCRLVCPPDGVILDPFTGSGTTGAAARLEGFRFIGCEMDPDYAEIARERIAFWETVDPNHDHVPKPQPKDERQTSLFGNEVISGQ